MFLGIKGTWHEYDTIVKTLKNISTYSKPISQPTASQSATRGEKIAKENKLKLLKNK